MNSKWLVERATEFEVWTDPRNRLDTICVRKCTGHRLPMPVMWKVTLRGWFTLDHDGNWEAEPIPSSRDEDYYRRCRFETLEEAWEAAEIAARAL